MNKTGNPVGSKAYPDFEDNVEILDVRLTSDEDTFQDRLGKSRLTWAGIEKAGSGDAGVIVPIVQQAVQDVVAGVDGQVAVAQSAADRAEAASNAAFVNADVKSSIEAGLSGPEAVEVDEQFQVLAANGLEYRRYRKHSETVAVEVGDGYPSASAVVALQDRIEEKFDDRTGEGLVFGIIDESGGAAVGVLEDGTFVASRLESFTSAVVGAGEADAQQYPGYALTVRDELGNVAVGVRNDGTLEVAKLVDLSRNDDEASDGIDRHGGTYPAQLNFIATQGQSLAGGSNGAITTAQEYDNVGFRANSTSPSMYYPLIVSETATTQSGGNTENPMYGTAGFVKELIQKENQLSYQENDFQLLSCCNGNSGAPIDDINKGGSRGSYEKAISQALAGKQIANSQSRSYLFSAVTWTQGESDTAMEKDVYKSKLIQLAADFNADGKDATGQSRDVAFISYQLCRTAGLNTVTPALLEASEEVSYIHLATPTYFMEFSDGTHLVAESSKWLGGYYGLVYKRVVVDGKEWAPLKPVSHAVIGNFIDLYFNKEGLVFDTDMMPPQVNHGFTAEDSVGAPVAISSVNIMAPNRVRLELAATAEAGMRIKYGHIAVSGKTSYSGPGGNLRDSAGDTLVYSAIDKPMHNWCVIFNYSI